MANPETSGGNAGGGDVKPEAGAPDWAGLNKGEQPIVEEEVVEEVESIAGENSDQGVEATSVEEGAGAKVEDAENKDAERLKELAEILSTYSNGSKAKALKALKIPFSQIYGVTVKNPDGTLDERGPTVERYEAVLKWLEDNKIPTAVEEEAIKKAAEDEAQKKAAEEEARKKAAEEDEGDKEDGGGAPPVVVVGGAGGGKSEEEVAAAEEGAGSDTDEENKGNEPAKVSDAEKAKQAEAKHQTWRRRGKKLLAGVALAATLVGAFFLGGRLQQHDDAEALKGTGVENHEVMDDAEKGYERTTVDGSYRGVHLNEEGTDYSEEKIGKYNIQESLDHFMDDHKLDYLYDSDGNATSPEEQKQELTKRWVFQAMRQPESGASYAVDNQGAFPCLAAKRAEMGRDFTMNELIDFLGEEENHQAFMDEAADLLKRSDAQFIESAVDEGDYYNTFMCIKGGPDGAVKGEDDIDLIQYNSHKAAGTRILTVKIPASEKQDKVEFSVFLECGNRMGFLENVPTSSVDPDEPGAVITPETPQTPEKPQTPETPTTPENPTTPEKPETPTTPDTPELEKKDPTQSPDEVKDIVTDGKPGSEQVVTPQEDGLHQDNGPNISYHEDNDGNLIEKDEQHVNGDHQVGAEEKSDSFDTSAADQAAANSQTIVEPSVEEMVNGNAADQQLHDEVNAQRTEESQQATQQAEEIYGPNSGLTEEQQQEANGNLFDQLVQQSQNGGQ